MEYVAMMVGVWGAWVVLRVIASERESRMRTVHDAMSHRGEGAGAPQAAK
jgi:hypothetical protein